jgi:hypothetical protein
MLDVNKLDETLDEIGFSPMLLRFLTDHERGQLERIVTRYGRSVWDSSRDLDAAGRLMYSAHCRAEMRHPGFE